MKNFACFATLALFFALMAFADENVGSYVNAYDGKSYNIDVRLKNNDLQYLYIYTPTMNNQTGYFVVKEKDLNKFRENLQFVGTKFEEWKATAEEQGISKMSKEFDVKFPKTSFFWIGTQQWIANDKLHAVFTVTNSKCLVVIVATVTALTNKYVDNTFCLVFSSKEQIDTFLSIIDRQTMIQKAIEIKNKTDLFN